MLNVFVLFTWFQSKSKIFSSIFLKDRKKIEWIRNFKMMMSDAPIN